MSTHNTRKLDLAGQRFGKLTVLAPAENRGTRTAWLCRCDCGRERVVTTRRLRGGRARSCGCVGPGGAAPERVMQGMLWSDTVRSNNTSGVPGVDWVKSKRRWRATICHRGKRYYLGMYELFSDAVAARQRAEENLRAGKPI